MATRSKAEQETIIRWDEDEKIATVYTACERIMKRFTKLGWTFKVTSTSEGQPSGWTAVGPANAVKLRRLADGTLVKAPRPANAFQRQTPRETPEPQT